MYALIMAGGSGTRFWPKSRQNFPKQLIPVGQSNTTLIQLTVSRILPLIKHDNIFIVTNVAHKNEIIKQLPSIKEENIICEPLGRNTAPCIGLGALKIKEIDPKATMVVLSADHFVQNEELFLNAIKDGFTYLQKNDCLVTIGINPTYPETGYGYIKTGKKINTINSTDIYTVETFTEKPDYKTACTFVDSSDYLWNCGTFMWRVNTILKKIEKFLPNLNSGLSIIENSSKKDDFQLIVEQVYKSLDSISIDYGILEHDDNVATIPINPGWSDVGSWSALYDLLEKKDNGNVTIGNTVLIDTQKSFIDAGKKVVAVIGLSDIIIVDTDDALLVCPKSRAQDVKNIVTALKNKKMDMFI